MEHITDQNKAAEVAEMSREAADAHDPVIQSITLGQDCTYFVSTPHGVEVTRQWYNGQTITNPADIEEVMKNSPVIRDITYA